MRVRHLLRPFHEPTVVEQFSNVLDCVGIGREMLFCIENFDHIDIPKNHIERLTILRIATNELPSTDIDLDDDLEAKFAGLELFVCIACIFNEKFMHKK